MGLKLYWDKVHTLNDLDIYKLKTGDIYIAGNMTDKREDPFEVAVEVNFTEQYINFYSAVS
jgi:hypothetical protein